MKKQSLFFVCENCTLVPFLVLQGIPLLLESYLEELFLSFLCVTVSTAYSWQLEA